MPLTRRQAEYQRKLDSRINLKITKRKVFVTVSEGLCVYYGHEQRDYTINILRIISGYCVGEWTPVRLDMSQCTTLTAAAMLMLFAEISRARIATGNDDIVEVILPENPECRGMLDHTGWSEAVSLGHRQLNSLFENDAMFQSGNEPGKATASVYRQLVNSGIRLTEPEVKTFTKGVTEAMLNVIHHAYSHEDYPLDGIGRRWWQLCIIVKDKDGKPTKLVFIIYDLGQGILKSLPALKGEDNSQHIQRAMTYGVTCTEEQNRGKGSHDIEQATYIKENSTLFIGTNDVIYIKMNDEAPKIAETRFSFFGTIVEWQINL